MTFPPEWHALGREAQLAAEQFTIGITALGRANHARKGLYTQAFFGLSIGFERLAKLVFVADHAITSNGNWLSDQELRNIGHNVLALLGVCEPIAAKYLSGKEFSARPNSAIHEGIVQTLSEFADRSRYYNLAFLSGGRAAQLPEPIEAWWTRVGIPILHTHYSEKQRAKDKARAAVIDELFSPFTMVLHHDETGQQISSVEEMMSQAGATRIVQKYGRLYVMQLIRWLSAVMDELSHQGAYVHRIEALLGLDEPFRIFINHDSYFLSRKSWSIYRS